MFRFINWLARLASAQPTRRRAAATKSTTRPQARFRPQLESLEDRDVMSTVFNGMNLSLWNGNLTGNGMLLDSGVRSYKTWSPDGTNYLVDLKMNGTLQASTDGTHWYDLNLSGNSSTPVQSFREAYWLGHDYLFELTQDGVLKTSYGSGWTIQNPEQSSWVRSFDFGPIGGSMNLVALCSNGDLYSSVGNGWVPQSFGVQSFALADWNGFTTHNIFELTTTGALATKSSTSAYWQTLDTGVTSFAASAWAGNSYVAELTTSGVLKTSTGKVTSNGTIWTTQNPMGSTVASFALGAWNGSYYLMEVDTAGNLKWSTGNGWSAAQDTGAFACSLSSDGFDGPYGTLTSRHGTYNATNTGNGWTYATVLK